MQQALFKIVPVFFILYIIACMLLYFLQERIIFLPGKLDKNYEFLFDQPFEEMNFLVQQNIMLNGILFKADSAKGLIFYLHGNAGSIDSWGEIAKTYTDLQYDVLIIDYRGYGKSDGAITSERQLYADVQAVYDSIKKRYQESSIVVLGYSIGTGPATNLASANKPRMLILQAPYYSLTDMARQRYPVIPSFLLKYKFETNKMISACTMPVVIFHGDDDRVISYNSSVKLAPLLKSTDRFITLKGQGHNRMTDNPEYIDHMEKILR